jgi:GT2 family glycosyltransferase
VREAFPRARVLRNATNEGFGRAANRGIAAGDAPYVFLCNLDLSLDPAFVARLATLLDDDPACGSACGKLLLEDGVVDSAGLQAYAPRLFADRGHGQRDDGRFDAAGEVFGASGAAVLYRRAMLDEIRIAGGVFDPDYFLYWEDIDLAWRARLAGWNARYDPTAVGVHRRGSASGRAPRDIGAYSFAHRLFTIAKNDDHRTAPRMQIHAATALLAAGLARKPEQWASAQRLLARYKAVTVKRREVQALRKTSSPELESWFAPLSLRRWALDRMRTSS